MAANSEFEERLLNESGFRTEKQREFRRRVLDAVYNGGDKIWERAWKMQDGYGTPGYTPPQGIDWSGIRDSSYYAIKRIASIVKVVEEY